MSSYKKYLMMGVTTILLPLGKILLQKAISTSAEESREDYKLKETGEFARISES